MGKSRKKVAEATVSLPPTKAEKNDKRRVEEGPEDRASSKKQKIETEQVDQNKKKVKKLKKTLNESPGEKKDEAISSDFEYGFAETPITIPPTTAATKGKRGAKEAREKHASSKNQIVELEKVGQIVELEKVGLSKKMVKKLKKTSIEFPEKKNDETWCSDFGVEFAETPIMIPPTIAATKGKRGAEEAREKHASSKNQIVELEKVGQIVELEKVGLSKKMIKKLKKTSIECPGKKNDETWCSDFGVEFAETPIRIPPTTAASKGKRGAKEAREKQASSKNQIVELEKVGQIVELEKVGQIVELEKVGLSKKMVKKLKKTSIEFPEKKNDETWCSVFGVEKSGAPKTKPVSSSKKKPELNDGSSKSGSDEEVGKPVKSNHKAAIAVSKKKGNSSDSSLESDSDEEVKETGNKRMDPLPDNAKDKYASKISEEEPEAPAKRNEESGTKRLFVGNLPSEVTKDDLLDFFKMSGEVIEIRLAADEDGCFRGFGHVEFVTEADARAALRMNGYILLGCPLIIDLARERGSNNPPDGKENGSSRIAAQDPGHSVFVKGFSKSLKEDQIRNSLMEHFGSCGKIMRISIPQDNKTGRSKGFAYVLFNDQASVSKALELSGTELGGYTLTVQEPAPTSGSRDASSFSGGRGRGGRSAGRGGSHEDGGRGRGRGGRGPEAFYNRSATTASKGKKTTFDCTD